jgi:UDP-N-acetylglucosamine--N-acetylmuramyl-(pentapeptide) pyrophosphoryl-undecaprenol N-acetylglucosamine transferase
MATLTKIVIMAGGTGGHVFPGLAIANALKEKNITVHWLGSKGGMETSLVPQHGISLHTLSIKGLRGKSFFQQLLMPFRLLFAICQAFRYLKQEKPDVVLGMGGFVAGPGGIAAKLLGIPLIIHEQNSIAGMTNRWLAKIATKVLCAFPNTFSDSIKIIVTGNPVREAIEKITYVTHREPLHLLILGGSRGAQALNEIVPQAIAMLPEHLRPSICHQTGQAQHELTKINYQKHHITAEVVTFIDDIAARYQLADLVVCRAGALTLAEITAVGLPSILIPYPHAVDDHQTSNARHLEKNGAAFLLPQADLTAKKLSELLQDLLTHQEKRLAMANAAKLLRHENAVEKIVTICHTVVNQRGL